MKRIGDERMLEFEKKELFNSKLLKQYDEDGQKGFLGFLLREYNWEIKGNKIIFPEIISEKDIKKALKNYRTDTIKHFINSKKEALETASVIGIEGTMKALDTRLRELNIKESKQREL